MTESSAWYENDDFWRTWGPLMFSPKRILNTPAEIDRILALVNLPPQARILDLPCGVGRHSLELARRGFKVTGVDRSSEYLKQAADQARQENLDIEFIREDMRNFYRPDTFDLALNLLTSFGYFTDQDEDRRVASNFNRSLKTGGLLIVDLLGKEILARKFQERIWHETEDGVIWLEEHKIINDWGSSQNRWIMFKDNQRYEYKFDLRLYSATELSALLKEAGFQRTAAYGGFSGIPYDHQAMRLVMVGHKGDIRSF